MSNRIAFFCSGRGGNFHFIKSCIDHGVLIGAEIAGIVLDRKTGLLDYCLEQGIPASVATFEPGKQLAELDLLLADLRPDIVVTNVHRILDAEVLSCTSARLINLHYSLLPAFAGLIGMAPLRAAISRGSRIAGCTTHEVVAELDGGPPIAQIAVPLRPDDDLAERLIDTIFRAGAISLLGTLAGSAGTHQHAILEINGRSCLYSGPSCELAGLTGREKIWQETRHNSGYEI